MVFKRERVMACYVVKFFKEVCNNGHEAIVCQGSFDVQALTCLDAAEEGKLAFCRKGHISDWSIHADRFTVSEAEFAS
jgi:hypothetical protein